MMLKKGLPGSFNYIKYFIPTNVMQVSVKLFKLVLLNFLIFEVFWRLEDWLGSNVNWKIPKWFEIGSVTTALFILQVRLFVQMLSKRVAEEEMRVGLPISERNPLEKNSSVNLLVNCLAIVCLDWNHLWHKQTFFNF